MFDDFISRRLVTEVHASEQEWIMSLFAKLMIGGWASTFAMVGCDDGAAWRQFVKQAV